PFLDTCYNLQVQGFFTVLAKILTLIIRQTRRKPLLYQRFLFIQQTLPIPLGAGMTISEFKGKKVQLGSTNVLIKDIGPGGIKIESIVKLPVRSDLVLKFNTRILGQNLELYGSIVWKGETNDHTQLYGISFIVDENERANLTSLLNQLQVKLRDKSIAPDSFFITDRRKFLKPTDSNKSKY
ncbi:PilZ domain-containing protein, partial [Calidifontibacillus erzurumensis]|uniref:PilZ domain-containing protein n=1 Tax=Calidifontibacillus erzurumensis TaxID=2741433 RepID=UPI0035B553CA